MLDLSAALTTALEAVAVARELLLNECARPDGPRGEIGHCPADDEAEWAIRQHLLGAFPKWGFLGEETGSHPAETGHDYVWVVDPNDGTRDYLKGRRGSAVSIGLLHEGRPVLGVVFAFGYPDDAGDLDLPADHDRRLSAAPAGQRRRAGRGRSLAARPRQVRW